jgi:hypothetical protein
VAKIFFIGLLFFAINTLENCYLKSLKIAVFGKKQFSRASEANTKSPMKKIFRHKKCAKFSQKFIFWGLEVKKTTFRCFLGQK